MALLARKPPLGHRQPTLGECLPEALRVLPGRLGAHFPALCRHPLRHRARGTSAERRRAEPAKDHAVHGLGVDIRQGNTYYEDLRVSPGRFDFVLANPPFNVSKIDKERIAVNVTEILETAWKSK